MTVSRTDHLAQQRRLQQALRDRRRSEGKCYRCETPLKDLTHIYCPVHLRYVNGVGSRWHNRRKANGICISCPNRARSGAQRCWACTRVHRAYQQKRRKLQREARAA